MVNPHEETNKAGGSKGYTSAGERNYGNQVSPGHPSGGYNPNKNPATKSHWSGNGGKTGNGKTKTTTTTGGGSKTGDGKKSTGLVPLSVMAANWIIDKTIGPWADKHNKKQREKFARKEGLYREYYIGNQYNKDSKSRTLDVMSKPGKDYLKEAGYGPFQDKTSTGGGGPTGGGGQQSCPDGTMAPCPPTTTSAPVPSTSTTQKSSWQLYPKGSDYITGQGYDTGGGVRKGPPPKRGPNPQVPPVLFSRGGGCAIRGTKFKGVK